MNLHRQPDQDGRTPVWNAALDGDLPELKWLMKHGAKDDVRRPDNEGVTPLLISTLEGHLDIVQYLFENGAQQDINRGDRDGFLPIHAAAKKNWSSTMQWLMNLGIDVRSTTHVGATPLLLAVVEGHTDMIRLLCENGAKEDIHLPTVGGLTPINAAAAKGDLEQLRILAEHAGMVGMMTMFIAVARGHFDLVQFLYQRNKEMLQQNMVQNSISFTNERGETMLFAACRCGNLKMAQWLVKTMGAHADMNRAALDGDTPLYVASWKGHLHIVRWLIEVLGASALITNNFDVGPLYAAAANGHVDVVSLLMKHGGANLLVDAVTKSGSTALLAAANSGHFDAVKLLHQHGADLRHVSDKGVTAAFYACVHGRMDMLLWIYEKGGYDAACKDLVAKVKTTPHQHHHGHGHGYGGHSHNENEAHRETAVTLACQADQLNVVIWLVRRGIPAPKDCPFHRMSDKSQDVLQKLAVENRDVDHQSFLAMVPSGLPLDVVRLVQSFVSGTKRTRQLWNQAVHCKSSPNNSDSLQFEMHL